VRASVLLVVAFERCHGQREQDPHGRLEISGFGWIEGTCRGGEEGLRGRRAMAMLKGSETEDRGDYSCYVDSLQHFGRVLDFSEIVGRGKLAVIRMARKKQVEPTLDDRRRYEE